MDKRLDENIRQTIGAEYEIVLVDNSEGKYGICGAYNEGVRRSKGDILCFMHEDVIYHSEGWGRFVEEVMSNSQIGILGVAGSQTILNQVDWRIHEIVHNPTYLIQGNTSLEPNPVYYILHRGDYAKKALENGLMQVAIVDGFWMCMRREIFSFVHFDDKNFSEFHLYDSDICMQVNMRGMDVVITDRIIIEHKSIGSFSDSFKNGLMIFFRKWELHLPIMKGITLSAGDISQAQAQAKLKLENHVKLEKQKSEIRDLIDKEKKGISHREFTYEELKIMDNSAYVCRKGFIKDKDINAKDVKKMICDYWHLPFAEHKIKLLWKYFWYRVCLGIWR